ncbi:rust resistance kinase Lr10-like [Lycium barbarum]|uniref:rust resistance kinase Lr10-like n=1 Tax=Lycium barbarum TaxID=112863 RepID=UPI00293E07C6|nr:rust resistance kinase Lr10-like [Lycium barbarum]
MAPTFLFLCCLIIFHQAQAEGNSESNCFEEFECGSLGVMKFPFTDSSKPECGLCKFDCQAKPYPKIELGGDKYDALVKRGDFFLISDPNLQKHLENKSCKSFYKKFSFPNSPLISFQIVPNLTLYRCNHSHDDNSQKTTDSFFQDFDRYNKCKDFNVYYHHPKKAWGNTSAKISGKFPKLCSLVQLPIPLPTPSKSYSSDLFELFTPSILLDWELSKDCHDCLDKGGKCLIGDEHNFHCSKGTSKRGHLRATWFVVATGAVLFTVGLLVLLVCFGDKILGHKYIKFWEYYAEDHQKIEAFLKNYGSYTPKRYNYSEVKRITGRFKNKLGQGGYGYVYKGTLHNGSDVAVKVLNQLKGNGEEFINEVASISRTSHVNIVSLVGFCFEGPKRALIYEFMPNGSLEKFIYEERSDRVRQLGWPTLYKIALGIARGLEYLHRGCNTRILHFDIKPHNILLDENFCPKISDFGLAKLCMKQESIVSMLGARGTIGYIAPEIVCRNLGGVSHKSDVYSYGMMVLEMVGGRKNVDVGVDRTSEIYFPHWIYRRIELDEELQLIGIMNEEEKECARKMVMMSLWCIQTDPSNRPSMSNVVEMLEGNQDSMQIPTKPYLYSPARSKVDSSTVQLA